MGYKYHVGVVGENLAEVEVPFWELDTPNVAVVLLICKGIITLDEGVNITKLPAGHLINEAEAWAIAGSAN